MNVPTVDEIDRIARMQDPIMRNLQITQCYYEISQSVAGLTGFSANWCTFATWASKQAGQTIREEDLLRAFEERFYLSADISAELERIATGLRRLGANVQAHLPKEAILRTLNPAAAFARAAASVARGNKKVFEEIGREFARFVELFRDDAHLDRDKAARFCAALRPGEPPDGQRLLSEAFTTYCEARFRTGKEKAELMLLANLCAGFHEQIRLQPEIAEALNASLGDGAELKRKLIGLVLPGLYDRADDRLLPRHRAYFDPVFNRIIDDANRLIRQVVTDHLMVLHLAGTEIVWLGRDLNGAFPESLKGIHNARLKQWLERVDVTPDSVNGSGAIDWADFADRMHFIADFFRVYQERQLIFDAPFTNGQIASLKSGVRPDGRL